MTPGRFAYTSAVGFSPCLTTAYAEKWPILLNKVLSAVLFYVSYAVAIVVVIAVDDRARIRAFQIDNVPPFPLKHVMVALCFPLIICFYNSAVF